MRTFINKISATIKLKSKNNHCIDKVYFFHNIKVSTPFAKTLPGITQIKNLDMVIHHKETDMRSQSNNSQTDGFTRKLYSKKI